jgi:hypothetical protein
MQPPTINRILVRDWRARRSLAAGLGFPLSLLLLTALSGGWPSPVAVLGFSLAGLASLAVFASRVRQIRRVFSLGYEVTGRIIRKGFDERGESPGTETIPYVIVAYEFAGGQFEAKHVTRGSRRTFKTDRKVKLVVDPIRPTRAFIVRQFRDGQW